MTDNDYRQRRRAAGITWVEVPGTGKWRDAMAWMVLEEDDVGLWKWRSTLGLGGGHSFESFELAAESALHAHRPGSSVERTE